MDKLRAVNHLDSFQKTRSDQKVRRTSRSNYIEPKVMPHELEKKNIEPQEPLIDEQRNVSVVSLMKNVGKRLTHKQRVLPVSRQCTV